MNNLFGYPDAIVYLIQYSDDPIYKIGYTTDMNTRLRRIAVLMPHSIQLIHTIYTDDPKWLENYWHNRFASKRRPGSGIRRASEWFDLNNDEVKEFKSHTICKRPQPQAAPVITEPEETLRENAIRKVVRYYNDLICQHPQHAVKLANSCNFQIGQLNAETIRMQSSRLSQGEAISQWEQRAYRAANKKV